MKLYSIEGNTQELDGGGMFGNAPGALWAKWLATGDADRIAPACRCLPATKLDRAPVMPGDGKHRFCNDKPARGVRLSFLHDHAVAMVLPQGGAKGRHGTAGAQARFADLALQAGP